MAERRARRRWCKRDGRNTRRESVETHILPTPTTSTTSWLHLLPPTGGELYVKSTWTFGSKKDGRIHSFPRIFPGKDPRVLSSMSPRFQPLRNRWKPSSAILSKTFSRSLASRRFDSTRAWNNFSAKFERQSNVEGTSLKIEETDRISLQNEREEDS